MLSTLLTRNGAALFCSGVAVGAASALASSWRRRADAEDEVSDDSDDDESDEEPLRSRNQHSVRDDYVAGDEPFKMLLIFNMELYKCSSKTGEMKAVKMSPGKAAAQSGHATLGAYRRAMRSCPNAVRDWLRIGQMCATIYQTQWAHRPARAAHSSATRSHTLRLRAVSSKC